MGNNMVSELRIIDLRLWVHLGCSTEERANPQAVSVDVVIPFVQLPKGAYTDKLEDSVCYRRMIELIQDIVKTKEFNLVESLTLTIHQLLTSYLVTTDYHDLALKVIVKKLSPPIPNLYGGVSFTYSA